MVRAAGPAALLSTNPLARREASLKANAASNNAAIIRSTLTQIGGLYAVSQVRTKGGCARQSTHSRSPRHVCSLFSCLKSAQQSSAAQPTAA